MDGGVAAPRRGWGLEVARWIAPVLAGALLVPAAVAARVDMETPLSPTRESLTAATLADWHEDARERGGAVLVEDPALGDDIERVHAATYRLDLDGIYRFVDIQRAGETPRQRPMPGRRSSGAGRWGHCRRARSRNPASGSGSWRRRSPASSSPPGMRPGAEEPRTASSCHDGGSISLGEITFGEDDSHRRRTSQSRHAKRLQLGGSSCSSVILVPACRALPSFGDGDDHPAELGEMAIKRERGSDAEPLHDGEAKGISQ